MPTIPRMTNVTVLPLGTYPAGTRVLGPIDIADDVTSILFSILCNTVANPGIWPNVTTVLDMKHEVSQDGGATWIESGRSVTPGGPHLNKTGGELQSVASGGNLPPPVNGITRKWKLTAVSTGPDLVTSASAVVT